MSLLSEQMEECTIIDRITKDDGYGGYTTEWKEGATIYCAIVFDTSMQARIGEVQGVKSFYTITTEKNIDLPYHQVLKRKSDGKFFRITSDGKDKKTPNSASLNMRQVTAEEYVLE